MKIVYTKDNCPGCIFTKEKLKTQGIAFKEVKIGEDITREEFFEKFPGVRSVPYVIDREDVEE